MRKIYRRRFFLCSLIVSIISLFTLIFSTIITAEPKTILTVKESVIPCPDTEIDSLNQVPTIPPNYLVVPYREFVLRTSISCRAYKLDEPKENPAKLHPKYSKYLRGAFPFVVPHQNISFSDVEDFYRKILPAKEDPNASIHTSFAPEITFENIPYQYKDRMWMPVNVVSAQRTAILVPLQGRDYNAKAFLLNMHAFARRQQLTYTVILIEQVNEHDI